MRCERIMISIECPYDNVKKKNMERFGKHCLKKSIPFAFYKKVDTESHYILNILHLSIRSI